MVCRAEGINSQNQNLKPERRKEEIARDNYHRRKFCRSHKAIRFSFSLISFSKSLPCMYVRMYVCKSVFFKLWTSYSITRPRCKRSFVSDNWCVVWTGSAFPQSFLSCKQSDAERTDFVHTAEQGHSWLYIIKATWPVEGSTRERDLTPLTTRLTWYNPFPANISQKTI